MEMEQMMERLLAKINARKNANTKPLQERADENLKELKEDIKINQDNTDVNLKEMRQ
jgi:hypothetical protein